jgi:hypothetical protein
MYLNTTVANCPEANGKGRFLLVKGKADIRDCSFGMENREIKKATHIRV